MLKLEDNLSRKMQRRRLLTFKMIKESRDRGEIKKRVKKWMGTSAVHKQRDAFDMAILETFFYIYYGLEEGHSIHDLGNDLGVFPLP